MTDSPKTLGQHLKETRESLGLNLEQVCAETRINQRVLQMIEADQYENLPARSILRGFILNYCKVLGLDGEQTLRTYGESFEKSVKQRSDKTKGHRGYAFEQSEIDQSRRWVAIVAVVGLLFVLVTLFILKPKMKQRHETPSEVAVVPTPDSADLQTPEIVSPTPAATAFASLTPTPTPTATILPTSTPTPTPKPSPSSTPSPATTLDPNASPTPDPLQKGDDLPREKIKARASFRALRDVYVRYRSDDRKPVILPFRAGKFLVIKAENEIVFEAQDASALEVRINKLGGNYEPLREKGFLLKAGSSELLPFTTLPGISALPEGTPPSKSEN